MLVIGEPCIDVIHKANGKVYHEHGGISYSIVAGSIVDDGIETLPIIGIAKEDSQYFQSLFDRLGRLNSSGIYESGTPVRRVDLFYEDENNRWECSTQPISPTPFEKVALFLPADGIHLNLIGGNDIDLDTLKLIRQTSPRSHIHLDLHNIVMRRLADGKRVRGPRPDYLEWSKLADTVQMNEEEAVAIDIETKDLVTLAEKILGTGVKAVVVSLAERGLSLYEKEGRRVIERILPARKVDVVDPTGSGDVFGAVFLRAVLNGKSFKDAAEAGVEIASKKVAAAGPSGLIDLLSADVERMAD